MIDEKPPFFSVVIPVYNKGPHIQRSISSVLNQSYQDFELIIVNDASTDNSLEEIMKFDDPRIRVLHRDQPGPGGYAARNLGIQEARADWIAFLDADDEWYPDHLSMHEKLIVEYPDVKVCGCGCRIVDLERNASLSLYDSYYTARLSWGPHRLSFLKYLQAENSGLRPLNGSTATIRRVTLIEAVAFPEGKANRGGDVDTWLRCVERAEGIAWSPHIGATYYRDSVNMVTRTQPFLAEVERNSVKRMISTHDPTTRTELMKFANRRTISAWRQSDLFPGIKNFFLPTKLYWAGDAKRAILWSAFSILPRAIRTQVFRFARALKHRARKMASNLKRGRFAQIARSLRTVFYRIGTRPRSIGSSRAVSATTVLADGSNPTFFGYHDKTPFSGDNSKVLAMSVPGDDTRAETECTPIQLGYFCRANDPTNEPQDGTFGDFVPFAETTTWCWQQGCMLQWNPVKPSSQVVFNTLVNGRYGSVLFDIDQQSVVHEYEHPIYSLDPGFRFAATLNFSRLGRLRPGYGYALLPDATAGVAAPEDDGLFLMDLASGNRELIVSLASLSQEAPQPGAEHYVNHATFSPDGRNIVFFHLWSHEGDQGRGLRVLCYDIETRTHRIVEDQRTISHYCWRDSQTILATNRDAARTWRYTLYNTVSGDVQDLNLPLAQDGHPMFHPTNKSLIVTDTYPDHRLDQHLLLANIDTNDVCELAALYSPWKYRGQVRCDLHPRWDRGGDTIVVDSARPGRRKLMNVRLGSGSVARN